MKRVLVFLAVLLFVAGCGKQEPAPGVEEVAQMQVEDIAAVPSVDVAAEAVLQTCDASYVENLRSCTPMVCQESVDLIDPSVLVVREIVGTQPDGTCLAAVVTNNAMKRECRLSPEQAGVMADYDAKWFASGGNISVRASMDEQGNVTSVETLNGEPVTNPLSGFLNTGVCTFSELGDQASTAMGPAPEAMVCYGGGTMMITTTDEAGNAVSKEIQCQPEASPEVVGEALKNIELGL